MILVFDTFIAKDPLYPNLKIQKLLDNVRNNSYAYRPQPKDHIFLYTVFSFKNYPWKKIYINFDSEEEFNNDKIELAIKSEIPNAIIKKKRTTNGFEFSNFFKSISKNNDWIFFSPNNDHPFIGPNISDLNFLVSTAEFAEKKYKKTVSIFYSHFTESINMIKKNNYLYFYTGEHYEILDQNEHSYIVLANHQPLASMQIMRVSQLINLFNTAKNNFAIRLESLTNTISKKKIEHIIIIPKFECCRHYDGYLHTVNEIKYYLSSKLVPPLFIPDGFFEKKIKLRDGYLGSKNGSISINESAKNYCFDDSQNGTNLKINFNNIPDSWKDRVISLDSNPMHQDVSSQIFKNKKDIYNPWIKKVNFLRIIFFYRNLRIFYFNIRRKLKKIILIKK